MGLIRSIRKSIKLKKISERFVAHGGTLDAISVLDFEQEEFLDDLYGLMLFDNENKVVVKYFDIYKQALQEKFKVLLTSGCGMSVRGHFVAISAFAFFQTLEYVFSSEPNGRDELELFASDLVNWFEDGRTDRLVNVDYAHLT